jgi:hypothetical protein
VLAKQNSVELLGVDLTSWLNPRQAATEPASNTLDGIGVVTEQVLNFRRSNATGVPRGRTRSRASTVEVADHRGGSGGGAPIA